MKKTAWIFWVLAGLALAMGLTLAQTADLSGTWIGSTAVPNNPERDQITLVLKKEGNTYSGVMSDSFGMVLQVPLKNVKYENGALSFSFTVHVGEQEMIVGTTMKAAGEKLVGSWFTDDGTAGDFELARKK